MPINTLDGYIAAAKQRIEFVKTATRTSVAAQPFSLFDIAGYPGAGTLAVGDTTTGLIPTNATAGYPGIRQFVYHEAYISRIEFGSTVAGRLHLFDRLFSCGAFNFNDNISLSNQPALSRIIDVNYRGLEIWIETVTAATGNLAVSVNYTNQSGVAGKTGGAVGIAAAPTLGRMWLYPLAFGDTGVQKIESVTGSVASAGTFNVHIMRPLWQGRVASAGGGDIHDMLKTGLPKVYDDSAFFVMVQPDSTSTGIPECNIELSEAVGGF